MTKLILFLFLIQYQSVQAELKKGCHNGKGCHTKGDMLITPINPVGYMKDSSKKKPDPIQYKRDQPDQQYDLYDIKDGPNYPLASFKKGKDQQILGIRRNSQLQCLLENDTHQRSACKGVGIFL